MSEDTAPWPTIERQKMDLRLASTLRALLVLACIVGAGAWVQTESEDTWTAKSVGKPQFGRAHTRNPDASVSPMKLSGAFGLKPMDSLRTGQNGTNSSTDSLSKQPDTYYSHLPIVYASGSEPEPTIAPEPPSEAVACSEMYWWHHNDGTPVCVPPAFYYDALAVVACETGGTWNPNAVGRLGEASWFQVHPIHAWRFYQRGWTWAEAWDPGKNTEIALEIWYESGFRPWSCSYVLNVR